MNYSFILHIFYQKIGFDRYYLVDYFVYENQEKITHFIKEKRQKDLDNILILAQSLFPCDL